MPGLAGSDGSPLVAWPFVVKFLVLPRRPPAVRGLRCHHPPPRAPSRKPRPACLRHRVPPPRSPPRFIIAGHLFGAPRRFTASLFCPSSLYLLPPPSPLRARRERLSLFQPLVISDFLRGTFHDNLSKSEGDIFSHNSLTCLFSRILK